MNCCTPDPPLGKSMASTAAVTYKPKPKYKYSFKHNAKIPIQNLATSSATIPRPSNSVSMPTLPKPQDIDREYELLRQEEQDLDHFIASNLKPLEEEVKMYEHLVEVRGREIQELEELLCRVERERFSTSNVIDMRSGRNTQRQL